MNNQPGDKWGPKATSVSPGYARRHIQPKGGGQYWLADDAALPEKVLYTLSALLLAGLQPAAATDLSAHTPTLEPC